MLCYTICQEIDTKKKKKKENCLLTAWSPCALLSVSAVNVFTNNSACLATLIENF